jgi:hypothetical protein
LIDFLNKWVERSATRNVNFKIGTNHELVLDIRTNQVHLKQNKRRLSMHILGFLFFSVVLSLALGVIAAMVIGNNARIVLALRGGDRSMGYVSTVRRLPAQRKASNVLAFSRPAQPQPVQPALLPLAA